MALSQGGPRSRFSREWHHGSSAQFLLPRLGDPEQKILKRVISVCCRRPSRWLKPKWHVIIMFMDGDPHDLERSLDSLWQCLSQGRRPLGVLLGAGCPVSVRVESEHGLSEPLIPDVAGLTQKVKEAIVGTPFEGDHDALISGLEEDLGRPPNIEDMLSRLRTLEAIAFDHSVRDLTLESIQGLERCMTETISDQVSVDLPTDATPYDALAVWASTMSRSSSVSVFTTNYDLLIESAFERNDVPFFDGFVGVNEPFLDTEAIELDDLPVRWARVWKLHGSRNWTLLPTGKVVRRTPRSEEERSLIHPSHLKYDESRRMPYVVMQDQLREFLRRPSATMVVLGYSFGDDHVNEMLLQGMRSNPGAMTFALQFASLDECKSACSLASTYPNLVVIARDGGVIAGRQALWRTAPESPPTICGLGDFLHFGDYLRQLTGRSVAPTADTALKGTETVDG